MNLDTFTTLLPEQWITYFQALPANQWVALVLLILWMWMFSLTASASFEVSSFSGTKSIKKVNKWPGRIVKAGWILVAYSYSENLWIGTGVAFTSMVLFITQFWLIEPVLNWFKPEITEEEKRKLRPGGGWASTGVSRSKFPRFNRVAGP